MNPLLQAQFDQIQDAIAKLDVALAKSHERARKEQTDRKRILRQSWSQSKELSVLQENTADIGRLVGENEQFRAREKQLREGLRRVLDHVKALEEGVSK